MNLNLLFRSLLIASILVEIAGATIELGFPSLLPQPLQDYLRAEEESPLTLFETLSGISLLPLVLGFLASYIGLFLWQSWSRHLFLGTCLFGVITTPLFGPSVYSGFEEAFYHLSTLLTGLIIGLMYFSPLAARFRPAKSNGSEALAVDRPQTE